MKKIRFSFLPILFFGMITPAWPKVIYVNQNAAGLNDGSNWDNAFKELRIALPMAQPGDEVWVAKGKYKPYIEGITNSFTMISGLKLLGGFAGWETSENQRDWELNETILTAQYMVSQNGVIVPPYNILYCASTDVNSIVDGFTFRDILAGPFDGESCDPDQHKCFGGGIFLFSVSSDFPTFLTIKNCRFLDNCCAAGGSAIGINFSNGSGGYTIKNCYFKNNTAIEGSALNIILGSSPQFKMSIDSCSFEENYAPSSQTPTTGAICIYNSNANIDLNISNSNFKHNKGNNGGAVFHLANDSVAPVKITNCSFISNDVGYIQLLQPGTGGALAGNNFYINGSLFQGNKAFVGGAINADWLRVENSLFIDNLGTKEGGAIRTYHTNYYLNSTFINNYTEYRGAAIFSGGSEFTHDTLINCLFYGNRANGERDWMATYGSSVHIANSYVDLENCDSLKNMFAIGDSLSCGLNMLFNIDPLFFDTTMSDYRPKGCSPLLNQGDSTWVARFGLLTDLAGKPRWQDGLPDIGAYEISRFRAESESHDVRCYDLTDGTATVIVEGGFAPYSFIWNGIPNDSFHTNLSVGIYLVIAHDSGLCADTLDIIIGQPDSLQLTSTITPNNSTQNPNGTIILNTVSGGTMPYTYEWSTGSLEDSIGNLASGTYTVTVTDEQGCSKSWEFEVLLMSSLSQALGLQNLLIYPNPAKDWVYLLLPEGGDNQSLEISDASGKTIMMQTLPTLEKKFHLNLKELTSGAYRLTVKQNGRTTCIGRVIKQP